MKFVNDPKPADLPALVAVRTTCGEAMSWVAGGDVDALIAFLGDATLHSIDGTVYRLVDGSYVPVGELATACVVVKPPAGDTVFLHPDEFTHTYACVAETTRPAPVAQTSSSNKTIESKEPVVKAQTASLAVGAGAPSKLQNEAHPARKAPQKVAKAAKKAHRR